MLKISTFNHIPSTGITSFYLHESVVNPQLLDTVYQLHGRTGEPESQNKRFVGYRINNDRQLIVKPLPI
jgi:hypothetical protein